MRLSPRIHQLDLELRKAAKILASDRFQKIESVESIESKKVSESIQNAGKEEVSDSLLKASRHVANAANYLPWRSDLWELAGRTALQAGDPQTAVQYLERAAQIGHNTCLSSQCGLSFRGWIELGDAYQQSEDLTSAIHTWLKVLEFEGPSSELAERLVQAYVSQGNYPNAISIMRTLVPTQPDDAQLLYRLGLYTATQNPEEALGLLERAVELEPEFDTPVSKLRREILRARASNDRAYSLIAAGRALASLEEWKLAAEAFHQATLALPDYSEAWAYLGEASQHIGDFQNSPDFGKNHPSDGLPQLEKALELDPKSLSANTLMALYWKRQMQYDKAIQFMRTAVSLDEENPVLQSELADILAASGDLDEAYDVYQRAASLSNFDPTHQKYLVAFCMRYDYHVEEIALPVARQLVVQYPDQPANLDLMAQVLIQLGDLTTAERFLVRSLQIDTSYAPAHLHLGLVYILQENRTAAYRELNQAISLDSRSAVTSQARRLLDTYFP
jgi:tetratricopeptide (TPR) repeat protein